MRLKRLQPCTRTAGQMTAEYAVLAFWTVVLAVAGIEFLFNAIPDAYYELVSYLCLPIP